MYQLQMQQKFQASLDNPLVVDERIVVERGADVTVQVVRVEQSGKFVGRDEEALELSNITIGGKKYAVASRSRGMSRTPVRMNAPRSSMPTVSTIS